MSKTQVVMLGSGTPNSDPNRSGPSVAIIVGGKAYVVDCGPGVVRRGVEAYRKYGIDALRSHKLDKLFITHLHSDHTAGYPDFILTPWSLDKNVPLDVFGPVGLADMTGHILKAYEQDIKERITGLQQADPEGVKVNVNEIETGIVYQDDNVTVEAIRVDHGSFAASFAYKFITEDKKVLISGDTFPTAELERAAMGCDILVHEVYPTERVKDRAPHWREYHSTVHTSAFDLGKLAAKAGVGKLVFYHIVYMIDINTYTDSLISEMRSIEGEIVADIKKSYSGEVICAEDLDLYE